MFAFKEGKELRKQLKVLVDDIFDNFWRYSNYEIQQIRKAVAGLESVNNILDKYDSKRKPFSKLMELFDNATGKK